MRKRTGDQPRSAFVQEHRLLRKTLWRGASDRPIIMSEGSNPSLTVPLVLRRYISGNGNKNGHNTANDETHE